MWFSLFLTANEPIYYVCYRCAASYTPMSRASSSVCIRLWYNLQKLSRRYKCDGRTGAVSHVCTNSCNRVRDVLILGTNYSDILSVSFPLSLSVFLSLCFSSWPLIRAHFRLFSHVYFAASPFLPDILYACIHHGRNTLWTHMVY